MQRYNVKGQGFMEEAPDGKWVRDVHAAALEAENAALKKAVKDADDNNATARKLADEWMQVLGIIRRPDVNARIPLEVLDEILGVMKGGV